MFRRDTEDICLGCSCDNLSAAVEKALACVYGCLYMGYMHVYTCTLTLVLVPAPVTLWDPA
jgi:hypothetical protein